MFSWASSLSSGRRTAASWYRAAGIGVHFRSYSYFLDAVGRKVRDIAAVLLQAVIARIGGSSFPGRCDPGLIKAPSGPRACRSLCQRLRNNGEQPRLLRRS